MIVQTIERQKQAGGTERAVILDASGRITGTATIVDSFGWALYWALFLLFLYEVVRPRRPRGTR